MLKFLLICLAFTAVFSYEKPIYPYPFARENNIIRIGKPTWQILINEFIDGALIYFYEEFSTPCKAFLPEYEEAAKNLIQAKSVVKLAKMECHDEFTFCREKGVTSFPTIYLHRGAKPPVEYRGPRTAEDLQAWILKVVDFRYDTINDEETLFKHFSTAILIKESSDIVNEAYKDLIDDVIVAKPGKSLSTSDAITILTQSGKKIGLNNKVPVKSLISYVTDLHTTKKNAVSNFNGPHINRLRGDKDIDLVLFFRTKSFSPSAAATKAFDEANEKVTMSGLLFAYVNVVGDIFGRTVAGYFGVTEDSAPTVGIISKKGKVITKYLIPNEITSSNIVDFVHSFAKGEAKRYYMSAEVPKQQPNTFVREIVGSNYQQLIKGNPTVNKLVLFYYPWCEPCTEYNAAWISLAYRTREHEDILIAQVDISQNDIEGVEATEYPLVLFYPSGSSDPIKYEDGPYIKQITKFLFTHCESFASSYDL